MHEWFTVDKITELAAHYRAFGPIIGFLLPFVESFLPFLPLFVFVIANIAAYGIIFGFLLSWGGTTVGSYAVFLIIRKYGRSRMLNFITRHKRVKKLILWVESNGFGPLFLFICFPFTPSALVNLVAGLANIRKTYYLAILLAGKFVMVFMISFVGYDIRALFTQPIRTAIVGVVILLLWLVGKWWEKRINKRVETHAREWDGRKHWEDE
ncbi:putative membrane protein YhjE [Sporosarcina sp. NCCP-2716]|uniref:TVP38/TMEM64 family protein n=1 Tax=Sporosarcina sp. NCCP-2716 TaxID=2943679 RepID=UPI002040F24C|nr:TVP38/TMEM64 family protein [Sporosarcina sp. NCCP-2716]GKV67555.1 putative membrane protein YhjE [Sporosarcina sp. NCCP-2716]